MRTRFALLITFLLLFGTIPAYMPLVASETLYSEVWVDDDASPDWYGDNHVATLQEAVSIVSEGGIIHVLPGEYHEGVNVEISKPVTIIGHNFPTVKDTILIENTKDVTITGLNFTSSTNYYAVYLYNVSNALIQGNQFGPLDNGYGIYFEYVPKLKIIGNVFFRNYETAIYSYAGWELLIENNTFTKNGESDYGAVYLDWGTSRAIIRNNVFNQNYYLGITIEGALSFSTIENNTLIANSEYNEYGIYAYSMTESTIKDNKISGYQVGIYLSYSANNIIEGNTIVNCEERALYIGLSNNHVVRYNILKNTTNSPEPLGAYLYYLDYSKFEGNILKANNHSALRIEYSSNVSLFEIPPVEYQWIELNPENADVIITGDDIYETYTLPFTFPFFGRDIVNITVNTNGLIELLEAGESPDIRGGYNTHIRKRHLGRIDAIFALNDDLAAVGDGYVAVYNLTDKVVIDYFVITYPDWDYYGFINNWNNFNITEYHLRFQVILYSDGRIRWNIKKFNPLSNYGDFWVGVYSKEENAEGVIKDELYQFNIGDGKSYEFSGEPRELMKNDIIAYNILENSSYRGIYARDSGSLLIKGNDLSNFHDAIYLEGASNLDILRNHIHDSEVGIYSLDSNLIEIHYNEIVGNAVGVKNPMGAWINATLNWWGASDGPSPIEGETYSGEVPSGSGDSVSNLVYFDPWLGEPLNLKAKLQFSSLSVSPTSTGVGGSVDVSATVKNVGDLLGEYTAELRVDGRIVDMTSGLLIPGEFREVTFTLKFDEAGTYEVTVDGLPPVKVYVGMESRLTVYNRVYTMAIIWTNLFFSASDDFNELYEKALNSGVDNETLRAAMEEYNESVALLLHAWNENSLEHLRRTLWNMRGVIPRIYEILDAYMKVKEAISILESGME